MKTLRTLLLTLIASFSAGTGICADYSSYSDAFVLDLLSDKMISYEAAKSQYEVLSEQGLQKCDQQSQDARTSCYDQLNERLRGSLAMRLAGEANQLCEEVKMRSVRKVMKMTEKQRFNFERAKSLWRC